MTLILAEWDARDHTLSWINCGHPPPVLRHADGRITDLDSLATVPVGIVDLPPKVRVAQTSVAPDDLVLFYSDGVYERRDADGEGLRARRDPRRARRRPTLRRGGDRLAAARGAGRRPGRRCATTRRCWR